MLIDIAKFIGLLLIVVLGFSQFFSILEKDSDPRYHRFPLSMFALIQTAYQQIYFWKSDVGWSFLDLIANVFMTVFVLLVQVSLINMLIAMQGNTYDDVTNSALEIWGSSWASIILHFEDSFWPPPLNIFRFVYDIYLAISKVCKAAPVSEEDEVPMSELQQIFYFHRKDDAKSWPPQKGAELIAKNAAKKDYNSATQSGDPDSD